jgi:hypothetical protein
MWLELSATLAAALTAAQGVQRVTQIVHSLMHQPAATALTPGLQVHEAGSAQPWAPAAPSHANVRRAQGEAATAAERDQAIARCDQAEAAAIAAHCQAAACAAVGKAAAAAVHSEAAVVTAHSEAARSRTVSSCDEARAQQ